MAIAKVYRSHGRKRHDISFIVNMVISLFLGFMVAYVLIELWLTIAFFTYKNHILPEPEEWPEISVLVAARNEEDTILNCLRSIDKVHYPKENLLHRQVIAVVNFPPRQIANFISECLVLGIYDENNDVILLQPERPVHQRVGEDWLHRRLRRRELRLV